MELPPPTPEALAHQQQLFIYLRKLCPQQGGWISFADFMQAALYAPGLGYYSAGMHKFGAQGDFVTAPEISPLFSQCIGQQCKQILTHLPPEASIVELGAGTGRMAAEIVHFLAHHQIELKNYYILEVSADLRQRQQQYLQKHCPALFSRFKWLDHPLNEPFYGIILGNEVIDAMPVHLFQIGTQGDLLEGQICQQNDQWQCVFRSPITPPLTAAVQQLQQTLEAPLKPGYVSEINLALTPWLKSLSDSMQQGVLLFIDYGFPRIEYYHPTRHMGTLMCHYRHHAHPDPLKWIGLQDITAHVDFTALAEAAYAAQLEILGFTSQAAFLLSNDLLSLAQQMPTEQQQQWALSRQIQLLTQPHEMGELFKVMALGKQFSHPLQGFQMINQVHRL